MWDLQDGRGLQYVNLDWMQKITGIKVFQFYIANARLYHLASFLFASESHLQLQYYLQYHYRLVLVNSN